MMVKVGRCVFRGAPARSVAVQLVSTEQPMCVASVRPSRKHAAVLAAMMLLTSCAVGPDFKVPASPIVDRYAKEPLAARTSSTGIPTGLSQHFAPGRDIPQEWWTLFESPALNALIKQAPGQATLTCSRRWRRYAPPREAVYAQQGKFLPFVQTNFNPTRNQTSAALAPFPSSNANIHNLVHGAGHGLIHLRCLGSQSAYGRGSLQAMADTQRFQVEAAYLTIYRERRACGDQRSLPARPDRSHEPVDRDQQEDARHHARQVPGRLSG